MPVNARSTSCTSFVFVTVLFVRVSPKQNSVEEKDQKEKAAASPAPLKDLDGNSNGGQGHSMMLPNGLSEDDKAFKYLSRFTNFSVVLDLAQSLEKLSTESVHVRILISTRF